nr:hypothetical protein [Burkholderia pseudomallei]
MKIVRRPLPSMREPRQQFAHALREHLERDRGQHDAGQPLDQRPADLAEPTRRS